MKQSNYEALASRFKELKQAVALRDHQGFFIFDSNGMSLEEQKTFLKKANLQSRKISDYEYSDYGYSEVGP